MQTGVVWTEEQALAIVPPTFRHDASVVKLSKFILQQVEEIYRKHSAPSPDASLKP